MEQNNPTSYKLVPDNHFDLLVFIGRFQPFHKEHRRIIDIAIQKSKHVLVLVGSSGKSRTIRNPFSYQERRQMILENYQRENDNDERNLQTLYVRPLFDKTYNDNAWIKQVQDNVTSVAMDIANPGQIGRNFKAAGMGDLKIGLIGASKDNTSYYLKMFPRYDSVDVPIEADTHSTRIREAYLDDALSPEGAEYVLPNNVLDFLISDPEGNITGFNTTAEYAQLQKELRYVRAYKESWKVAPYPVKHATLDTVVVQSGHILVVKRRSEPGKGLWALPGGHLEEYERQVDGAIRELREETKIKVPEAVLRGSIVAEKTFDDPHRSTLGRVITQAFYIKLPDQVELPKVKGADDAEKAVWLPIGDMTEDMFFDDHFHIINYFLGL